MALRAMHRRTFIAGLLAISAQTGLLAGRATAQAGAAAPVSPERTAWLAEALVAFPYDYVRVEGRAALREWEWLKAGGRGAPVVIGGDRDFEAILQPFHPDYVAQMNPPSLAETLARSDALTHPDELLALQRLREQEAGTELEQMCREDPESCRVIEAFVEESGGGSPRSGVDVSAAGR